MSLPEFPDQWSDVVQSPEGWMRQRWLPGAFGELERVPLGLSFKVVEYDIKWDLEGVAHRTIRRVEIIGTGAQA